MEAIKYESISFDVSDGIGTIILDDAKTKNAISLDMLVAIQEFIEIANNNVNIRAILIRGANNAFSSGANVNNMSEPPVRNGKPLSGVEAMSLFGETAWAVRSCKKPVVSLIQGSAAGAGLSLALASDFRFIQEDAKLVFAFSKIGLIPDMGAIYLLSRMVGWALAEDLFITGRTFTGCEAKDMGLATKALPADEVEAAAIKFTAKLAAGPTLAYSGIKEGVNLCMLNDFQKCIDFEVPKQGEMLQSADHKEGAMAFIQKRLPEFKGL